MRFKEWLLITEEEKDINLSNPNLTTIPALNTSVSNPNLTTTIPALNARRKMGPKYKKPPIENFKELAYYFGRNGSGPSQHEANPEIEYLGKWHNNKKSRKINPNEAADKETWDDLVKLSKTPNWIDPVTKQPFRYKDLPKNWRDVEPKKRQEKGRRNSSENFKELAYYFGRNGSAPSTHYYNKDIAYLAKWHNKKKIKNTYEASDDEIWAEIVASSKSWNKEQFPYELPKDWRDIEPAGKKSLGEEYVLSILTELGIENKTQYRDVACKNKMCLPFDFSITHNGKKYFVEYHGKQHYYPTYFGSTEGMTDQVEANHALNAFKYIQVNDKIKHNHCEKGHLPFLVIPYWLYKKPDIVKNRIKQFLETNEFNETFANPDVPQNYKEYHDKIYAKYLAESNPIELVEPTKTFEQFLINKNFINI